MEEIKELCIIAGNRNLPFVVAEQARKAGMERITAIAFDGETDPRISEAVDEIRWVKVGQVSKTLRAMKDMGVKYCVMAGQVAPSNLFHVRPDLRGVMILMKLKKRNAHTIFGAIGDELEKEGITLISTVPWLKPVMPGEGFTAGVTPSDQVRSDAEYGFEIAKAISKLEIGQTVVVKEGTTLAVEGWEGTDACISRGGELSGGKGAVVVKVARLNHDMRFDIPCVGMKTLENCKGKGICAIVFEANKTLLLDQPEICSYAKKIGITLMSYSKPEALP
ncbi:MAG: UDP-2,3-diacylglucosamine diphosphatase LpxI [Verrucomicrobia bacterium]|nr:UDP-2,3-diacylglucosamine diphosphatase LpxI [Verrucomicrobiota bacterium]